MTVDYNKRIMQYTINDITAIILAGGKGTRMGNRNKGLLEFNGKTFIARLLDALAFQSKTQIISANDQLNEYRQYRKTVIQDISNHYSGPLAGIVSCQSAIDTALVLTVPCDSPIIPSDLSTRLLKSYNKNPASPLCVAHDGERLQNLFMLFNASLLADMQQYFENNQHSVYGWIIRHQYVCVDFSDKTANFININDEASLLKLNKQLL